MPFEEGHPGNPAGGSYNKQRKQISEILLPYVPQAVQAIIECLGDPDKKAIAAKDIMDRVYGKAVQNTNISGELNIPITVNIGEKRRD